MLPDTDKNRDSSLPLNDFRLADMRQRAATDEVTRDDPLLRVQMVKFISDLDELLLHHAALLAQLQGEEGAFAEDETKDLMVWQLGEYILRSHIDRDPCEPPITRGWQMDEAHACDFFDVSYASDKSLVALYDEEVSV